MEQGERDEGDGGGDDDGGEMTTRPPADSASALGQRASPKGTAEDPATKAPPPPPPSSSVDDEAVEQTIRRMERARVCLHPTHCHSFQPVHVPLFFRRCLACQGRFPLFGGGGRGMGTASDSSNMVVRCVACGAVAHRSCAQPGAPLELPVCPVNKARLEAALDEADGEKPGFDSFDVEDDDEGDGGDGVTSTPVTAPPVGDNQAKAKPLSAHERDAPGRPRPRAITSPIPTIALPEGDGDEDDDDKEVQQEVHVTPLHYAHHPFASISRALQENVLAAHLRSLRDSDHEEDRRGCTESPNDGNASRAASASMIPPSQSPPPHSDPTPRLVRLVAHTFDLVKATVGQASSTVRSGPTAAAATAAAASVVVAGGALAGGMAGFVLAGPAGCYAGSLGGASALGVILEGGVSVGIFVGGVAAGGYAAQQAAAAAQQQRRRVLALGEEGAARKVLLIRPQLQTDPVWDSIAREARRTAPGGGDASTTSLGAVGPLLFRRSASAAARYRREADIVSAEEDEIPTKDKVLLLVGRALSDKSSLPGYVYRYMVEAFLERCENRRCTSVEDVGRLPSADEDAPSSRVRRDDVHAVIRYVTEALLEFRPALGGTPTLTEWTATAVESLVFGRLYDPVFEEIVADARDADASLLAKIRSFEEAWVSSSRPNLVSEGALEALHTLPQAHSAADKLHYCVRFLERLSEFYLAARSGGSASSDGAASLVCADSLLKLTCQHVIAARLPHANAEVAFLEEFARDEQLLRGREGYSLVTLQAALHFLNRSEDLERDIFDQDDVEENLPVAPPTTKAAPDPATSHALY